VSHWNDIELSTVPVVPDFAVELRALEEMGQIVHFVSASRGELAWFPAWEHAERDLIHFTAADVPFGSIDIPYDDRDEGWRIVIFEDGGYVYIFEDDRPNGDRFPRRYRVARDRYFFAWAAVMNAFNPVIPLDEE
jgi:hypothetical protein